ncbi:MAG: MoaD/ThiS family protein [Chloroflexi bacterium]|nr:MoaD/ThiS family protein [Chloroflexota bacterium]
MASVHLPRSLVTLFPDPPPRQLELDAATVLELVEQLEERWPGVRDRLCQPGPAFREHINVFIDGERVGIDARLSATSVVHFIPAVAGG